MTTTTTTTSFRAMTPGTVSFCEPLERRTLLAAGAIKIMPLGDSITEGLNGHATWRYWLWHDLRRAGRDVDFVGSKRGVWAGEPRFADFDQDHEGHVGDRTEVLLAKLDGLLARNVPDVVLLHIGSNDMFQGQPVEGTIDEVSQIIDRLRLANPRMTILLAQIIPSVLGASAIPIFNQQIPQLAARKTTAASPVIVVDHYSGFDVHQHTYDYIHPNEAGERMMAGRWMAALSRVAALDPNPYLSDLPFDKAMNGLGPVERDRSNGSAGTNDGRTIKLNNALYRKGLGVHANSDVRYELGGRYKLFTVRAGIDDEVRNAGSVIFRIYVDFQKVYDSGPVYGRSGTKVISIDVSGARQLRLVVTDKGDGASNDHADWADARLFSQVPIADPTGSVPAALRVIGAGDEDDYDKSPPGGI